MRSTIRQMYTRKEHYKAIFGPWWAMLNGLWSILSSADTLVGKYGSDGLRRAWDASWVAPRWGWKIWAAGVAVTTAIFAIELSFRRITKHEIEAEAREKQLQGRLDEQLANKPLIRGAVLVAFSTFGQSLVGRPIHSHTRLVLVLKLTNHKDVPTTIDKYELMIRIGTQDRIVLGQDSFSTPMKIEHQSNYKDAQTSSDGFHYYTSVIPMRMRIHSGLPLGRAATVEGAVILDIEDAVAGGEDVWYEDFSLTVIDALGNRFPIPANHTMTISCLIGG